MKRTLQLVCLGIAVQSGMVSANRPSDNWMERTDKDKVNDSVSTYMFLVADHEDFKISNWLNRNFPRVIIGCHDRQPFFSVAITSPPKLDASGRAFVMSRVGNFRPVSEMWDVVGGGGYLRMRAEPINAAVALTLADKYLLRYAAKEGADITLEFSLEGIKNHLPKIAQACGWDYAEAVRQVH